MKAHDTSFLFDAKMLRTKIWKMIILSKPDFVKKVFFCQNSNKIYFFTVTITTLNPSQMWHLRDCSGTLVFRSNWPGLGKLLFFKQWTWTLVNQFYLSIVLDFGEHIFFLDFIALDFSKLKKKFEQLTWNLVKSYFLKQLTRTWVNYFLKKITWPFVNFIVFLLSQRKTAYTNPKSLRLEKDSFPYRLNLQSIYIIL